MIPIQSFLVPVSSRSEFHQFFVKCFPRHHEEILSIYRDSIIERSSLVENKEKGRGISTFDERFLQCYLRLKPCILSNWKQRQIDLA
ncbi:Glutamine synthetase [Psidium guajava]|nr:Glutamine synthetase [Psidium guajava]